MGCGRGREGKRRLPLYPQCPPCSRPCTAGPKGSRGRQLLPRSGSFHGHMQVPAPAPGTHRTPGRAWLGLRPLKCLLGGQDPCVCLTASDANPKSHVGRPQGGRRLSLCGRALQLPRDAWQKRARKPISCCSFCPRPGRVPPKSRVPPLPYQ